MKIFIFIFVLCLSFQARAQSVISFDPAAPVLPSNTLRFYLTFSHPSRGLIHQRDIKLIDSKNNAVENAFMDFGQELWSPDGKRLTVMFDPGKVKRGVEAVHSELSPLKEGGRYKITLGKFQHAFRVGPAVREKIDPALWVISSTKNTAHAIQIKFDRVMDTALAEDQLEVDDASGQPVSGMVSAIDGGRGVLFTSSRTLRKGEYQIKISPIFEDVAGNRIGETLDHSVGEKSDDVPGLILKISVH